MKSCYTCTHFTLHPIKLRGCDKHPTLEIENGYASHFHAKYCPNYTPKENKK